MIPSTLAVALALAAGPQRFEIVPVVPTWQRLDVPPALVSASARGDLADLRLRDSRGREVPYLLVRPTDAPPRWIPAARIRPIPVQPKKASGAEIDLGEVRDVTALRLKMSWLVFARTLRLEGSADGARWTTLAGAATIFAIERQAVVGEPPCAKDFCGPAVENDVVRFDAARVRWLRVIFDDRGMRPLGPPRSAEVLLAGDPAPAEGPSVSLAIARRDGEPGVSRFAIVLPGPHLPVRAIRLDVEARHLWRVAQVVEPRFEGGRLVPHELGSGLVTRTELDGVAAAALRVPLRSLPEEQELELVVHDGDNGPLALRGATAELAPLPWIAFGSDDGAPLVATAGDPALAAPHYDLEASRSSTVARASELPRARVVPATASPSAPASPPSAADAALPGAPLDANAFGVARSVAAAQPGLAAVRLDAAILAASPDLSDVRIVAPDGRQVPYLAEERPEPLAIPLDPSGPIPGTSAAGAGVTVRALPLAFGAAPRSRLVLETSARVFTRSVRVYVEDPDAPAGARAPVAEASWAHGDPTRPARPLELPLPAVRGNRLLVALDDGDNASLPITSATLLLPAWRLRFFHPGPELRLVHGASGLAPPRYDLALLAPRLRAAPAREVALGPAPPPGARRALGARTAFWIVLAAAVGGLLVLVARLVRPGRPQSPPPS